MAERDLEPLTDAAQSLIAAARDMHDPAVAERARTYAGLEEKLLLGAAASTAFGAFGAAKVAAAALAASVLAGTLWLTLRSEPAARPTPVVRTAAVAERPTQTAPEPSVTEPEPQPVPEPSVGPALPRPTARVHHSDLRSRARERAATNINTDLARETDLLRAVNAALNAHDGATALQRIAQYDGSFRHGLLREERGAAELLALCMLRRIDAARRKLTAFVTRYPQSPLRVRVESACAGQDAGLEPRR